MNKAPKRCSVDGCERKYRCSGFCGRHYATSIYAANPEKFKQLARDRRKKNPEKGRLQNKKWRLANPGYEKKKYREDPSKKKAAVHRYHLKNPAAHYMRSKNWKKENPEKVLAWQLKQYGIDVAIYDQMLAAQGGGCAICHTTNPGGGYKRFPIDHDHKTNKVRGLLCSTCNLMLGLAKDAPETLREAAAYLEACAAKPPKPEGSYGTRS